MIKRAIAVAITALLGILGLAVPAHATFPCEVNEFCLYTDANYSGNQINYQQPPLNFCSPLVGIYSNSVSSLKNRTNYKILVYDTANCTESGVVVIWPIHIQPFQNIDNWSGTGRNDKISSFKAVT